MGKIEKLSVALTSKQVEALREAVDEGDFASTSEAVRRAVTEWVETRDRKRVAALQRIRPLRLRTGCAARDPHYHGGGFPQRRQSHDPAHR